MTGCKNMDIKKPHKADAMFARYDKYTYFRYVAKW